MKKLVLMLFCAVLIPANGFSGVTYFDYKYHAVEGELDEAAFSVIRSYLTYQEDLGDGLSYKFQTDIDYKSSPFNVYLKNAKVDWKCDLGKATIGMQGMNAFNVQEKTWGHRFLEKSPMDKHGFANSADMGFGFNKSINDITLSITYTNGGGYKKPEEDKYKKTTLQAFWGKSKLNKNTGFNLGGMYSLEPLSDDGDNVSVFGSFIGFSNEKLRFGLEYDMKSTNTTETVTEQIIAFYSNYKVNSNLEALIYVDMFDPWTDSVDNPDTEDIDESKDNETYVIAGFNCSPSKSLIISPNIRMTTFENGSESDIEYKLNFQFKVK